ncbi:putative membrane protein [Helicobacter pylori Hp P-15b]|uniref:Putative membrane protein n=1 Tax=Helicobacter pylori Hp P-15 TaxID=992080 RepID=I9WXV3_HELPX|nr:putative membrane protein [Helicobacter pylori Hp P-15]EJC33028.1 putative membrane protein [Helicobacter pylori Hp P-15b]
MISFCFYQIGISFIQYSFLKNLFLSFFMVNFFCGRAIS